MNWNLTLVDPRVTLGDPRWPRVTTGDPGWPHVTPDDPFWPWLTPGRPTPVDTGWPWVTPGWPQVIPTLKVPEDRLQNGFCFVEWWSRWVRYYSVTLLNINYILYMVECLGGWICPPIPPVKDKVKREISCWAFKDPLCYDCRTFLWKCSLSRWRTHTFMIRRVNSLIYEYSENRVIIPSIIQIIK